MVPEWLCCVCWWLPWRQRSENTRGQGQLSESLGYGGGCLFFLTYFFFSFFYPLISYKYTEACVSLIINFSVDSD